jgi:hypothetical protein
LSSAPEAVKIGSEAEKSPLLEAVVRDRLVKTADWKRA